MEAREGTRSSRGGALELFVAGGIGQPHATSWQALVHYMQVHIHVGCFSLAWASAFSRAMMLG